VSLKIREVSLTYKTVGVQEEASPMVDRADKAVGYMSGAFDSHPEQESFWVVMLNRRNRATARQMITLGTQTSALAHPREVFRAAILGAAAAIICVHNHPSGDPSPSAADVHLTRQLSEAARAVDIPLLDHVIIGERQHDPLGRGYYSFREAGLL
jgi:DNA repair protein RadC